MKGHEAELTSTLQEPVPQFLVGQAPRRWVAVDCLLSQAPGPAGYIAFPELSEYRAAEIPEFHGPR